MKTILKHYPIYKKRDGQSWNKVSDIYADTFENAKKEFALNMTKDNWNQSNNVVWLTESQDKVQTGWYDMDCSTLFYNDNDEIDYSKSNLELLCSEESILQGFDNWREDVYSWEIRDVEVAIKLWEKLGNIPVNEDDEIDEDFDTETGTIFEKGTETTEIWHWFEETFNLSVAEDLTNF